MDYPELPVPEIEGTLYHPVHKICYSGPAHFTAAQMHAYLEADRARAAPGSESVAVAVVAEQEAIIRIAEALYLHGRHLSEYDNGFNWGVEKFEQYIRARTQPAPGGAG